MPKILSKDFEEQKKARQRRASIGIFSKDLSQIA
jgi:hypothetical protein